MSGYHEADQYVYVPARGFADDSRKMPTCAWVNDCPDDIDPRSLESPHTCSYDETDHDEPYIIVGARDGYMLDIDVDVGDDHDETFSGDIEDIRTPKGILAFLSASGGPHRILKFEREHEDLSGATGVDLQGDIPGSMGVVTSPFHHPDYEITNEPDERVCFDNVVESGDADLNTGFGMDLLADDEPESGVPSTFENSGDGGYDGNGLTPEQAADALDHINPDVGYDKWFRIGVALEDEYPDSTALRLFTNWSRGGAKWDSTAEQQAERIIEDASPGSGRTMGTVTRLAQENGWNHPAGGRFSPSDPKGESDKTASADGGTVTASGSGASASGHGPITPMSVMARAGLGEDDDLADLTDRQKAYYTTKVIESSDAHHLLATQPDGELFRYDSGVWGPNGEQLLREIGHQTLAAEYSKNVRSELEEQVRATAAVDRDDMGAPEGAIAAQNGLLYLDVAGDAIRQGEDDDLADDALRELRPGDRALKRLGTEFDPDAECPRFREFVGEVIRPDDIETVQEYAGYTLLHWAQPYKRAMLLLGPQDSGKSTFLNVLKALLGGRENVSAENLDSLINSRWGTAKLYGKIANIANELETHKLESVGQFKTITGGGDLVSAEQKGKDLFEFEPTAKQLFAANQVPPASNPDDAFYSRWLFATFPESVPKHEQEEGLDREIIENELAGVLNWALEGYARLREQGGFTNDPLVGAKRERWEAYGNSVKRFKHSCLEVTGDHDDVVVKEIAHDLYARYCREEAGVEVETQNRLTRELKKDEKIGDGRRKVHPDDKRRTAYTGIKFHPDALDALDFDPGARLDALRNDGADADDEDDRNDSGISDFGDE